MLKLFISYAHQDANHLEELTKRLKKLRGEKLIESWLDQKIKVGEDWEKAIDERLRAVDLAIFLLSPDFFASDYCTREFELALEQEKLCQTRIFPVNARKVDWRTTHFAKKQVVPSSGPVSQSDSDTAWGKVEAKLREVILDHPKWRRECYVRRYRPAKFEGNTLDVPSLWRAARILCQKSRMAMRGTPFDLIVGVNQSGMATAAMLNKYCNLPAGVIVTEVERNMETGRPVRLLRHIALPEVVKEPRVLVVDGKLKSGRSAIEIKKRLEKDYSARDVQFAMVLAFGGWTADLWELPDPYFAPLVRFKKGPIDGYVAYYTDADPETIGEELKPQWDLAALRFGENGSLEAGPDLTL